MERKNRVNGELDIDTLKKLSKDDPKNVEHLKTLSEMLMKEGNYDEAANYWESFLKLNPNSDSYQSLGNCYYELEEYDKAKEALLSGLKLKPDDASIFNDLGIISMAKGVWRKL